MIYQIFRIFDHNHAEPCTLPFTMNCPEQVEVYEILSDLQCNMLCSDEVDAHFERLATLLKNTSEPDLTSVVTSDGCNALHVAAQYLNMECCELFLSRGADPKAICFLGRTAAHAVAMHVRVGDDCAYAAWVLQILDYWGVNFDTRDIKNQTPLELACDYPKYTGVVEALLNTRGERLGWKKSEVVDINVGNTPLKRAVFARNIDCVIALCSEQHRPDSMRRSIHNQSWIDMAVSYGFEEIGHVLENLILP